VKFSEFKVEVATVRCEPSGREVRVAHDTVLMDAVFQAALPLGQSCDGIALCGFCRVQVLAGLENLSSAGSEERNILAAQHAGDNERLACCARIHGPITVTTDYW
jgi:nitrite reductase (NADH) large subunit